jgi:hypothetical protein
VLVVVHSPLGDDLQHLPSLFAGDEAWIRMTLSSENRVNKCVRILRWIPEDRVLLVEGVAVPEASAEFTQRE